MIYQEKFKISPFENFNEHFFKLRLIYKKGNDVMNYKLIIATGNGFCGQTFRKVFDFIHEEEIEKGWAESRIIELLIVGKCSYFTIL